MVGLFMAVLLALTGMAAHAAAPAAGASISNQASASYTDASATPRTVTSNVVSTTVTQVTSMTLTANGTQTATPGSVVYYPHTLTNTGNGTDTFNLTTSNTGGFNMTGVQFFADNGSGTPTGPAITSTGPLAAGASFKLIAVGTLPNTATATQTNTITVTGTSTFTPAVTASNTDVTTVTTNAVVTLTKGVSVSNGLPGTSAIYTLTYTNTGNSTATAVAITDVIPAGMTFTPGTARWSVTGAANAIGSVGTAPDTLVSSISGQTFVATLGQVTAGQSGTISFQVTVNAGVAPSVLNNTATTSYNNGASTVTGTSNTVPFTVLQTAAVTLVGPTATPTANPGSTVSFTNVVTNTGTGVDTFNITLGATNNFPAGTTFQLFKAGGLTPLVDTNGDGIIDTGPMAVGATYDVILKATLPPNATSTGAPFSITKKATSVFNPAVSSTGTDTLTTIANAAVDLTNTSPTGPGVGAGLVGDAAQVTNTTNPGTTTTFTLVTNNTGPSPDSYNLTANNAFVFGGTLALPTGWTVTFKADNSGGACTTTGASIINTGNVPAGGSVTVCAVVTVPAGFPAGTSDLYFRAQSPTSGVVDVIRDAVTVNAVRSITITPNGAGQTYPGGSYVYSHTLTNNGNVLEGDAAVSALALATANNQPGWTSTLYFDAGSLTGGTAAAVSTGNGALDGADPLITGNLSAVLAAGLAPGQSVTIFDKVIAPSGAVPGSVNATSVTVTTTNGSYTIAVPAATVAVDSTTVIAGNLTLVKEQALAASTAGVCAAPGTYGIGTLSAKPGDCVYYRITATNVGSADATLVVVSDVTPTFTTINTTATMKIGAAAATAATATPAVGATGAISANIGTLLPAQAAVVIFSVKLDQ
ncbi:MAG: hypothetical protein NTZ64_06810 [Polaromonas sp.]|nr:hypothetical protein [Polaromonas sp.]